ncbi:hypothetical protein [Streptomyces cinerochromogenes]|uniref:hypothetical protein n=1 Tax=Streptomyces cinerochromogenes TaxID=66422 RepID=UPI001670A83D|nr:hypothetical protein [Streptomyces cinerochromogenes]GGS78903.1 hypothetical protein GCM10010206_46700 [Streptomyces cinerochromogenes]
MAWDEWEQLKTGAKERGSTRMQLNHLADPIDTGSSTYGDLKVSNSDLVAIGKEAHSLYDQLWNKARVAQSTSESAAGDLAKQGFTLGKGLKHVAQRWDDQLRSLLDACAQISNHMHVTKKIHSGDDGYIGRQMSSIDALDAGFDDRAGEPGRKNPVYYPEKKH